MRRFGFIAAACFVGLTLSCGGIAGPVERRLVGDIGLAHRDTRDEMAIVVLDGAGEEPRVERYLVGATVFAVGWDHTHVIAKVHPREEPRGPFDRTQTDYYIVGVRDKRVHGPFDRVEFVIHCDLLGVAAELDFTLVFTDLE